MTIDNSSHEQLTTPETTRDLADRALQKLAMKSYLEARRSSDLRKDLAARLLPSEGPFAPGDWVYYWQIGTSKIKHGTTSGQWYNARVLSQERGNLRDRYWNNRVAREPV